MQELIYRAGRLIEHGRRMILGLGANDRAAKAFQRLHGELFAACGERRSGRSRLHELTDPENRIPARVAAWARAAAMAKTAASGRARPALQAAVCNACGCRGSSYLRCPQWP